MDKTLDEMIKTHPKPQCRPVHQPACTQIVGSHGAINPAAHQHIKVAKVSTGQPAAPQLPTCHGCERTTSSELFHSTVDPLREVTLHYDSTGRSKGVALVHFQRKGDVTKAFTTDSLMAVSIASQTPSSQDGHSCTARGPIL
ncbi:hypothetical protein GYMLUDRAFT_64569 [Collybiopsis luxurians FD-317 M1]|uniref:RRM domain-containing protein n=1 Tax=Collybiopsis luxurians FD-317 M1 TaxID=944289 RepID=A0A0D0CAK4_9AGAR|nr:hypothetical protein GYMLUDRAFT_64569 [Collybiopsis luxurians FD-317 M1]